MEPERVSTVEKRLLDGYYEKNGTIAVRDLMLLLKLYRKAASDAERYWELLNAAELKIDEMEQQNERRQKRKSQQPQ